MEEEKTVSQCAGNGAEDTSGVTPAAAGQEQTQTAPRMSWQEIMADPEYKAEYDRQVQELVRRRLRGREDAEAKLTRLSPVLEAISGRYFEGGADWDSMDMEELGRAVSCGMTASQLSRRSSQVMERLGELVAQGGSLRERFPGFSLDEALSDPRFVYLTAPGSGLSLEDAYYALHRSELTSRAAREGLEAAARSVSTGARRPHENRGTLSGTGLTNDPAAMTKEERSALRRRIHSAAAEGKKIRYGE